MTVLLSDAALYSQNKEKKLSSAQELSLILVSNYEIPDISYEVVEPPKYWTNGMLNQIGFSQVSLTNWANGGYGSIAMNAYINAHANYAKDNMFWENRGEIGYGFINSFEEGARLRKSEDKVVLDSKWGYRAIDQVYMSAIFNFKTQLTPSLSYDSEGNSTIQSALFAPGYLSLGLGADYKPNKDISFNLAPLTGNLVIVTVEKLRTKYGNAEDQVIRGELGAQIKIDYKKEVVKNLSITTALTLFYDYINKPEKFKLAWDTNITLKFNKYFTTSLRTNLIYDEKIKIADKNGENKRARVQFKEIFSLNFSYTIGNYQKPK